MNRYMKHSVFKSLSRRLMREAEEEEKKEDVEKEEGNDSLDDQIDTFLKNYESESKNAKNEGVDLRSITRRFLSEAGEDEEDTGDEGEDEAEEPEEDEPKDEEPAEEEPETPPKPSAEDIDMGNFTSSVVRLVDNFDNLVEVRNTILRRAANYLSKNYESDAVESFKEELMNSHGLEIGKSKFEKEDEEFQAPKAGFAGPMGGGGGGGV